MTTTKYPDSLEDLHVCGMCRQPFTLTDLFGHDCPNEKTTRELTNQTPAGLCSVDIPDSWTGGVKASRTTPVELATGPQLAYVAKLGGTPDPTMSKRAASKLIDTLKANPPADVHQGDAAQTPPVRSNRFAGPCATCSQEVAAETGSLTSEGGRWVVRHVGTCPTVEAPTASPATVSVPSVPDGYYAIASTGSNDLAFYKVKHSDRWGVSVSLVVGGHADSYVRRNAVAGILVRIAEDVDGAAKRYADEIGNCYRCNRHLTDEESRRLGIGPTCRNLA